ncbi:O-antigen ligase family protein [Paludibaculum fermentans]|uniref:O-antigen ligase family protein n=1 Tax=Paludibaculum fermentans TaxID=1473598 RepID=UPI003EB92E28
MPPLIALVMCTAFVLVLLRVELLSCRHVSGAFWIPTLWMLSISSKSLALWSGVTGEGESGSPLDRLILTGLGVVGCVVLAKRRLRWAAALSQHGWLLALLFYMLISTLWSDMTLIALKRWMRETIVVIMAMIVISEADPRQALECLLRRSAYILIPYSLMLLKYYPSLGRDYARWSGMTMWSGVTPSKNTLGCLCLISSLFLFWALFRRWREPSLLGGRSVSCADASVLLIALYLLKGPGRGYSATSIGCLVLGIATFLGLRLARKVRMRLPQWALLALVILLISLGVATPFLGGSNLATFTSAFGRDETFTGRTWIWEALMPEVWKHALFGQGFQSFWTGERREMYFSVPHAHNGYLDIVLELGFVGLALATIWLLSCVRKLHRALEEDYDWASLALSLVFVIVVYNFTETTLNRLAWHATAVITIAAFAVPYDMGRAVVKGRLGNSVGRPHRAWFGSREQSETV